MNQSKIYTYNNDIPESLLRGNKSVAIDTEALGLNNHRDRLCLVQLCFGDNIAHLVQIEKERSLSLSKNLIDLLYDNRIEKIFHFGRFDIALLYKTFNVLCRNVFCTKIASYIGRTYSRRHGLKDLCKDVLSIEIGKFQQEQSSYWGSENLRPEQEKYAANDVLYLHSLKKELEEILLREKRLFLAKACFNFLPDRAMLDVHGWDEDIFSHSLYK